MNGTALKMISLHILLIISVACHCGNDDKFTLIRDDNAQECIRINDGIFFYSGAISGIAGYLLNVSSYQIMFRNMVDYSIIMTSDEEEIVKAKKDPLQFFEKRLGLDVESENMSIDGLTLNIINPELLAENSTSEGGKNIIRPQFSVSDSTKAYTDTATLTEMANFLTDTKHKLYYYKGDDNNLYKWNFEFRNNLLMRKQLENNYGIQLKKETLKLPVFVISPSYH